MSELSVSQTIPSSSQAPTREALPSVPARERPILFSAPMVRALLAGTKTQTRRIVKFVQGAAPCACDHPHWHSAVPGDWHCGTCGAGVRGAAANFRGLACPYGAPGDSLWVREAWQLHERFTDVARVVYSASLPGSWTEAHRDIPIGETYGALKPKPFQQGFRPSIHMPRWASRITLRITDVRVERLQDISEADARAEGCAAFGPTPGGDHDVPTGGPVDAYEHLWNDINGPGSWAANPWVWAVSFERANPATPTPSDGGEAVMPLTAQDET